MSEYQCYRWHAVGRVSPPAERKKVEALSSRISVSSSSAEVVYHWGNFKHHPIEVLCRHFDVFTYEANWGSQTVAFRFDANAVRVADLGRSLAGWSRPSAPKATRLRCCFPKPSQILPGTGATTPDSGSAPAN